MAGYPYYPQQPMMSNPYGQIQPYQDRLAQLQNNYQQAMPYGQMQMQQPVQQMQQMPMLQGQMVDGIDTVKAKDVDMSGNPVYYPKTDGTEIYKKQLQAENSDLKRAASQDRQSALIVTEMNAQTQRLINSINPSPIPAFQVPAPYAYAGCNGYGNGCC